MSVEAMTWAWKQKVGSGQQKLVLVVLSDSADPSTGLVWLDIDSLKRRAEMSEAAIKTALLALSIKGFIKQEENGNYRFIWGAK